MFPRLRRIDIPKIHAALREIEDLEADHRKAESQHKEVDAILHQWMMDGGISPKAIARLRRILTVLSELYEHHILLEETGIFPLAAASLSMLKRRLWDVRWQHGVALKPFVLTWVLNETAEESDEHPATKISSAAIHP